MRHHMTPGGLPTPSPPRSTRCGSAAKAGILASGLLLLFGAQAQVAIFEESFTSSLGQFTAAGNATTGPHGARMAIRL